MDTTNNTQGSILKDKTAEFTITEGTFGKEVLYSLKSIPTVDGPCDGKPDNTSCGFGCKCVAGQPWYSGAAIIQMGIKIK